MVPPRRAGQPGVELLEELDERTILFAVVLALLDRGVDDGHERALDAPDLASSHSACALV
jgi:hypothetical protein